MKLYRSAAGLREISPSVPLRVCSHPTNCGRAIGLVPLILRLNAGTDINIDSDVNGLRLKHSTARTSPKRLKIEVSMFSIM